VEDKAERRRLALRRLLREAEDQEAAPTDQDLAIALGVSRRTVIRDRKRIDRG
jgi:predicted DNA-binding transcriptional regulator YafY